MSGFDYLQIFGLGALGGCLVELVRWWKLRTAAEFPEYARKFGYWAITLLMIIAGGIVATLYGLDSSDAAALVNIGASTPAILAALASKAEVAAPAKPESSGLGQKSFAGSRPAGERQLDRIRRFIAFGR
jgi:hypothetical protein